MKDPKTVEMTREQFLEGNLILSHACIHVAPNDFPLKRLARVLKLELNSDVLMIGDSLWIRVKHGSAKYQTASAICYGFKAGYDEGKGE